MLTSKLLLPVAGNLTLLGLGGLFALSSSASALACPQATVTTGGHADTPLPFPTVRLLHLFLWMKTTSGQFTEPTDKLHNLNQNHSTRKGEEDIRNTIALKAKGLTPSSQYCRNWLVPLSPKQDDHSNSAPLPCLRFHLDILK